MPGLGARARGVLAVTTLLMLTVPVVASATTGTSTDLHEQVTITAKGTTWKPAIGNYAAKTGTTVRFTIINDDSRSHWYQFGKHRTSLLKKGASVKFFYNFTRPVPVTWEVGPGKSKLKTYSGKIKVEFPPSFH